MALLIVLLMIGAAVCFLLAASNAVSKLNLVALGLLFWVLALLIPALVAL